MEKDGWILYGMISPKFHILPFDESVYSAIMILCISDDKIYERVGNDHFLPLFHSY